VLCSSAARTLETLELVRSALGAASVMVEEELYGASCKKLLTRLRLVPDAVSSVMLIGHNPGLHELATTLHSRGDPPESPEAKFPTGALATLAVPEHWTELAPAGATLTAYVVPKQLR
jgi:phosphohistidine phosphatase